MHPSHIRLKQLNRAAESGLLAAETILAIASVKKGSPYPTPLLDDLWERLCLWQFHDSICGCHADAVADEADDDLNAIVRAAHGLRERGFATLATGSSTDEVSVSVFNPCLTPREEVIALDVPDDFAPTSQDGAPLPTQRDGRQTHVAVSVPPIGFTVLRGAAGPVPMPEVINAPEQLKDVSFETGFYHVEIADGELDIAPKALAEPVFAAEGFGEIMFREDRGDLWTENYLGPALGLECCRERVERVVRGPVFTRVHILGEIEPGPHGHEHGLFWDGFVPFSWEKEITFFQALPWFLVKASVVWGGKNTEIGIRFPLRVDPLKAAAVYAIPFGHLERQPYYEVDCAYGETAREFPPSIFQKAKGNWPALGWVDYSEPRFGVTIANRGNPGHRLQNGVVTVSLLRSPTSQASAFVPGVGSWENGKRVAEFGLLPHEGALSAECIAFGEAFNRPLVSHVGAPVSEGTPEPVLAADCDGIVLSALKRSEDGEWIVARFYEALGREVAATVSTGFLVKECWLADLNEAPQERLEGLRLDFGPFEIKTVLLQLRQ